MQQTNDKNLWLEIDLTAIEGNVGQFIERTAVRVMAVVKANGYGHGLVESARAVIGAGAAFCGIARVEEGLELRRAGIEAPILVMGRTADSEIAQAVVEGLHLTVFHAEQIAVLSTAARISGQPALIHVKVDTGMSRLGISPREAPIFFKHLADTSGIQVEGIFTHLARADEPEEPTTAEQENLFRTVIDTLDDAGLRPPLAHAANSAGALTRPSVRFDMIRAGIAIYGLEPFRDRPLPDGFRPAMSWKARLVQVRKFPPGTGVSYGHEYTTTKDELIGVVPVGYGDGFRRVSGNEVLVHGKRVPVRGRVCMDQLMVGLDEVPQSKVGDEVVLLGTQGGDRISAEEVGIRWGTINYEVTSAIPSRVPRIYKNS
jgi:alanine racemase